MKSIGDKWLKDFKVEKDDKKCTECFMKFCSILIETVGDNVQRLRLLCNVDPNFSYVPARLIN